MLKRRSGINGHRSMKEVVREVESNGKGSIKRKVNGFVMSLVEAVCFQELLLCLLEASTVGRHLALGV